MLFRIAIGRAVPAPGLLLIGAILACRWPSESRATVHPMQSNPFAPPNAQTADPPNARMRRPLSVWFVVILATAVAALFAYGTTTFLAALISGRWPPDQALLGAALRLVVLIGIAGAVIGSFRGTAWGRWLGLLFIIGMLAVTVHSATAPSKDDGPLKKLRYTDQAAGKLGEGIGDVLFCSIEVWWFFAFGFSRRARAYFADLPPVGADHVARS